MMNKQANKSRKKDIYLLFSGQFFLDFLSVTAYFGFIWHLTRTTASASLLAMLGLAGMLPSVLLSPVAGTLIDKWNRKKLLIGINLLLGMAALLMFGLTLLLGELPIVLIFASVLLYMAVNAFTTPAIQSAIPTLVPADALTQVNGRLGMLQMAAFMLAPIAAAATSEWIPVAYFLLFIAAAASLNALCLAKVALPKVTSQGEKINFWADTRLGLGLLRKKTGLWYLVLLVSLIGLFLTPLIALYPFKVMGHFGGTVVVAGTVEVVFSLAGIVGAGLISIFGKSRNRLKIFIPIYGLIALVFAFSGLLPGNSSGLLAFIALQVLLGLAFPIGNILLTSMLEQSFPAEHLGRVLGVFASIGSIGGPIGLLFAGPLADRLGVNVLFLLAGIAVLLLTGLMVLIPVVRNYDKGLQLRLREKEVIKGEA